MGESEAEVMTGKWWAFRAWGGQGGGWDRFVRDSSPWEGQNGARDGLIVSS